MEESHQQRENGNFASTAGDGAAAELGDNQGRTVLLSSENGAQKQSEDGFSGENAGKGEKIVDGGPESIGEEEARENICDSIASNGDDRGELRKEVSDSFDKNSDAIAGSQFPGMGLVKDGIGGEHADGDMLRNPQENDVSGQNGAVSSNGALQMIRPHMQLPKPEVPPGVTKSPSENEDLHPVNRSEYISEKYSVDMPAIGKFIREKSNSFSAAIVKSLSSLKEREHKDSKLYWNVTEFNLSGLKVIVQLKTGSNAEDVEFKGRVSFFSRSNCRDSSAVRSFFREIGLKFVEINIDVYQMREKELMERTGSLSVPQIFFNEKLIGGLVALNSLRNSGLLEQRMKEMLGRKCPDDAPAPPVYGFDDPEAERTDAMLGIVKVLRQRLPIQDRLMKMKIVKNCFSGREMVEVTIQHLNCNRTEAIEIGKQLARKHFIHHVFGENEFEDGNHFYRFLEHEPFISKCCNFRGAINDCEPKPAAMVSLSLTKIMFAILESYASEDRLHLDYLGISNSEEFRRYLNLAQDLHRVDILALSADEKLAFFLNLYNAMVIHAVIRVGHYEGVIDGKLFYSNFKYLIGGHPYSLVTIRNGILRGNRRPPYSLIKPFGSGDKRLELIFPKVNPLIHFGLCDGTRSSPPVRFYTAQGVEAELRRAAREFLRRDGIEVDLAKRTIKLSWIIKWFSVDFGQEKEILKWIMNFLDATKAGLLNHLVVDGGPINVAYQNYDWSVNS